MSSVLRSAIKTVTRTEFVDSFSDVLFSRVVYPTEAASTFALVVDGSDPLTISGIGDVPTSNGGVQIPIEEFVPQTMDFLNVTYSA